MDYKPTFHSPIVNNMANRLQAFPQCNFSRRTSATMATSGGSATSLSNMQENVENLTDLEEIKKAYEKLCNEEASTHHIC